MIVFLNDDRAYHSWVTHHRRGFVLDSHRRPAKHAAVLHRASCSDVKHSQTKKTHWTTGPHLKACSLDADELRAWATQETGSEPTDCPSCLAAEEVHPDDHPLHLTKLDKEI